MSDIFEGHPILKLLWIHTPAIFILVVAILGFSMGLYHGIRRMFAAGASP